MEGVIERIERYEGTTITDQPPEYCDDGNNVSGDGCSDICNIEDDDEDEWVCVNEYIELDPTKDEYPQYITICTAVTRRLLE